MWNKRPSCLYRKSAEFGAFLSGSGKKGFHTCVPARFCIKKNLLDSSRFFNFSKISSELTLTSLQLRVLLVDDVDTTFTADNLAILVAYFF